VTPQVENVKDFVRKSWNSFRTKTGYYQVKVWLSLAYVTIAIATVFLAPPTPAPLEASLGSIPWGANKKTFVDVTNVDIDENKVRLFIKGQSDGQSDIWQSKEFSFPIGESLRLWPRDFVNASGVSPSKNFSVDSLDLRKDDEILFKLDMRK